MKKTKRSKKSRSWVIKQHRDQFYKKSKTLGYRSRSSFKLIELNQKYKFLKNKTFLLDIGSSPGGWSQIASQKIKKGKIVSIDIKDMEKLENVKFIKCDFLESNSKKRILDEFRGKLDVVISDMAASTTGNKNLDCIRTNLLCSEVILFASDILKNKGKLISKLFMGEDFLEVKKLAKEKFEKVEFFKPESSRNESKETYIHCSSLKTL
ncbi:MAG: 23S rRNA (uridine2552-2'-O)-methyltransferase [Pelagibacterales bacterium]|nr:23S rRNA (uridine2552-2'-O)-methyltransferase [Pelagibacterales bacterium]